MDSPLSPLTTASVASNQKPQHHLGERASSATCRAHPRPADRPFIQIPSWLVRTAKFEKLCSVRYRDLERKTIQLHLEKVILFWIPSQATRKNQRQSLSLVLTHLRHFPNTCKPPFFNREQSLGKQGFQWVFNKTVSPGVYFQSFFSYGWKVTEFSIWGHLNFTLRKGKKLSQTKIWSMLCG